MLTQYELCLTETEVDLHFHSDYWQSVHTGFEIDVEISAENNCDCFTLADNETGVESKTCVKSYFYNDTARHQCTLEKSSGNLICATEVDENGNRTAFN